MRGKSNVVGVVSQGLGIPQNYCCQGPLPDLVQAFVYSPWITGIVHEGAYSLPPQHDTLSLPEVHSALHMGEKIGDLWQRVIIQLLSKKECEVYPLARESRHSRGLLADISYSQLLHYVSTSNSKNLWKDAYKKYSEHGVAVQWKGGIQVGTEGHNKVLREVLRRLYGCRIIPMRGDCGEWHGAGQDNKGGYRPHNSVLPALCAVEGEHHIFLFLTAASHTLHHAVSFSPAKLNECEVRPLFVLYQLLEAARETQDRGLHLGDITLRHLFIDNALYLSLLPNISDSFIHPELTHPSCINKEHSRDRSFDKLTLSLDSTMCKVETENRTKVIGTNTNHQAESNVDGLGAPSSSGRKGGSSSDGSPLLSDTISDESTNFIHDTHSEKTLTGYQRLLTSEEAFEILKKTESNFNTRSDLEFVLQCSLIHLTQLWVGHQLTTLDYLLCLNYFAGRVFNSPHHHPIIPWVVDFSSPEGGWRDLTKTKFRLTKGDQQLDQTYQMVTSQGGTGKNAVAHHVTEIFSEITYYVYKARVTPQELLTRYVRQQWVPEHYPSTIARLYAWTPDEAIPEFYTDPEIFKSQHEDLGDLGIPEWCRSTDEFLAYHRAALEGNHVSSRLHHWIDLNFGNKLSGGASVKAKNVCLQLVDAHTRLTTGGVVQLFSSPHPPRLTPSPYLGRSPPKFTVSTYHDTKLEKCDDQSEVDSAPERTEDDTSTDTSKPLEHSRRISRSRTSLCEEKQAELSLINIPVEYNPLVALNQVEMLYNFVLKASLRIPEVIKCKDTQLTVKQAAHLRRVRDMQAIGCVIVELFSPSKCRVLGICSSLQDRYVHARKLLGVDQSDIPRCIRRALQVIFQTSNWKEEHDATNIPNKYEPVSTDGLPPPSPHQLLQSLINVVVFPSYFPKLYQFVCKMRQYSQLLQEAQRLRGDPHKKKEFILTVAEIRVKMAAKDLPNLLPCLSSEGLDLLLPYLTELFEYSESAVTAAWYLTSAMAQALGPQQANKHLLPPVVKLFETEVVTEKHLKLFHRSFLLQLVVWLGLEKFLSHFITPLIEGVGGYKEVTGRAHHTPDIVRKQSTSLKSVDINLGGESITSPCEDDSNSSAPPDPRPFREEVPGLVHLEADLTDAEAEPEVFVFEGGDDVDGSSPDTPLQEPSDQLMSPVASETLSLDEVSLQEGIGSIPSLCPSPHSPSMSGGDGEDEEEREGIESGPDTPTPLGSVYSIASSTSVNIPKVTRLKSTGGYSSSLPDFRLEKGKIITSIDLVEGSERCPGETQDEDTSRDQKKGSMQKEDLSQSMSDVCCESVLWLAGRLGPVLTARYITRNLLRMLTLCYLPDSGALTPIPRQPGDELSVTRKRILGDIYAKKVLHCLSEIACLYGEQVILLQYLCHICELVASCRRKLSPTMEGGLLGAMALLQHLLPYLTDGTFMEHLQETLIRSAVYPVIRLLSSTKVNFPHGGAARGVLACRVVDCLFVMALRVGREMSKSILMPTITRFLTTFDKCHTASSSSTQLGASPKSLEAEEVLGNNEEAEGSFGNTNLQASPSSSSTNAVKIKAIDELKQVMTPELAYLSYVPLCRFLGATYMEAALPNHDLLRSLCLQYDENNQAHHAAVLTDGGLGLNIGPRETSGRSSDYRATNVAMIGNRIDIKDSADSLSSPQTDQPSSIGFASSIDISKHTNNKMENTQRHLRGNWLAYWEHEIGRSEQDIRFNFKQIKLQTFSGHTNSVKSIHVLDNENSFISCSKDKTVKLWSLRNQGDGNDHISAQWTYTGHKKSVFGVTFSDAMRYAASCDSTVHVWDPFICAVIKQLDSLRHSPVTVLTAMTAPSTQLVAATTDATLKFIDLRTCSYTHEFKVSPGGAGLVRCVDTSGDGRLVTVAHSSGVISALDIRTGHLLTTWKPHEGEVLCMRWYQGSTFISSALDQTVSVWSVEDSKMKFTLRGPTEPVHLMSIYGDELLTGTTANRVGVHTSISSSASFSSTRLRSDTFRGVLTTMAVLPLNRILLLGADNGTIRLLC